MADTTLTQDIDDEGNLINIGKNTQEESLAKNDSVSVADIRSELFEGDNVDADTNTDRGLSALKEIADKKD